MRTPLEPYRIKAVEPLPITTRPQRERALADASWNLFRLPARLVTIDLLTDSGMAAMSARQWGALVQADESYAGAESFYRFEAAVRGITGFPEVIPAHQGRAAERLLFEALVEPGDVVPGNTHFDTTRANLERLGARPVDLPTAAALLPRLDDPFKGNLDLRGLEQILAPSAGSPPPLVLVTITSNSTGGQPVSLDNLRRTRLLCDRYGVRLFLDAARFAENAWLVREREAEVRGWTPAAIARAFFDLADGCLLSAKKDGLVNIGGLVALRDPVLAERIRAGMVVGEGFPTYGGLAGRDLDAMAIGLREALEPSYLEHRIGQVRALAGQLDAVGVPIVRPPGGHAVYLDSRAFAPHLDALDLPGQAIACELYLHAGVRTTEVGQLMRGRPDPDGRERPVPVDLVRLAIPRRVYTRSHLDYVAEAVRDVFGAAERLQPLDIVEQPPALRHFRARLRPRPLSASAGERPCASPETGEVLADPVRVLVP
jgi:tryptophanase